MPKPGLEAFRSKRDFVQRLLLAEILARPGEGPLAPRFRTRGPRPERELTPPRAEPAEEP